MCAVLGYKRANFSQNTCRIFRNLQPKTNAMNINIIGATFGIGKELAQQYLAQGHTVFVTGRR